MRFDYHSDVRNALRVAEEAAWRRNHGEVTTDHVVAALGGEYQDIDPRKLTSGKVRVKSRPGSSPHVLYSSSLLRALHAAMKEARRDRLSIVDPSHLLAAFARRSA